MEPLSQKQIGTFPGGINEADGTFEIHQNLTWPRPYYTTDPVQCPHYRNVGESVEGCNVEVQYPWAVYARSGNDSYCTVSLCLECIIDAARKIGLLK